MAKNWTVSEAYDAIKKGDKAAIADIGKRYPCLLAVLAKEDVETIMGALPEYLTARKMEGALKGEVDESETDVDSDDGDAPAKRTKQTDEEKKAKAKARREARKAKKEAEEAKGEDEEENDDEVDYSEMSAIELYKLCKKRKLNPEQKQKASVYINMLKKADEAENEEDEDDDWEDEEEEEKPAKKKAGRPAKAANKKKIEEDDDEEWDI